MVNNKLHFTKRQLDTLPLPENSKRIYFYDTKVPDLGISITASGAKTFIVYRKVNRRPERITLGRYPTFSIEQARSKAAEVNLLINKGDNPYFKYTVLAIMVNVNLN
jgi:hypothetical protein